MKLCNDKKFTEACVYHEKTYYFFSSVFVNNQGIIQISICNFNGKWRSDIAYLNDIGFAVDLFNFALKNNLITTLPEPLLVKGL